MSLSACKSWLFDMDKLLLKVMMNIYTHAICFYLRFKGFSLHLMIWSLKGTGIKNIDWRQIFAALNLYFRILCKDGRAFINAHKDGQFRRPNTSEPNGLWNRLGFFIHKNYLRRKIAY